MSTLNQERQWPLAGVADMGIANIGAGNEITFKIQPNTLILDVDVVDVTAFNGSTNTLTVTDGTTVFHNAVDVKAAANTLYSATIGKYYPSGGTLTVSMAQTGSATAGRALVAFRYVVVGRSNEIYRG